jgi:tripartite-type tricarboxylate transporter receptor subunit TctC
VDASPRSRAMSDVLALAEQGFPGCVFTPAGRPKPIIDRMHAEMSKALQTPDLRNQLIGAGAAL